MVQQIIETVMNRVLLLALVGTIAMSFGLKSGPDIQWEKTTHDFGQIPQGKPVSHVFKFTNTGDQPLQLTRVKASCGCTTPTYDRDPVKPGESGIIKAVYNASASGNFTKSIAVTTNIKKKDGTEGKRFTLYIKGNVVTSDLKQKSTPQSPVKQQ